MIIPVNAKDIKALTAVRDNLRVELRAVRVELDAVDKALAAANARRGVGIAPTTSARTVGGSPREYGAVGKAISEALPLCPAQFQFSDVVRALSEKLNRPLKQEQISLALNRLIKQGKIEVSKPRHGRTPAIYKKM
jgi:hypothetical protein